MQKVFKFPAGNILVYTFVTSELDNIVILCFMVSPRTNYSACNNYVLNSAARFVTMSGKSEYVMPLLFQLLWLPVEQHIKFIVLLFAYKAMQGVAPKYLSDLL